MIGNDGKQKQPRSYFEQILFNRTLFINDALSDLRHECVINYYLLTMSTAEPWTAAQRMPWSLPSRQTCWHALTGVAQVEVEGIALHVSNSAAIRHQAGKTSGREKHVGMRKFAYKISEKRRKASACVGDSRP